MDLCLDGKHAFVCASSRGLGKACAVNLAKEGAVVTINGRDEAVLMSTKKEIESLAKREVSTLCCDITTDEGIDKFSNISKVDILVNNAGGPKVGEFKSFSKDDWIGALNSNMVSAIRLINIVLDSMSKNGYGRIINITSGAIKEPNSMLSLSNGSRMGLIGYVAGIAREVASSNITINNILPGKFYTDRLKDNLVKMAQKEGVEYNEFAKQMQNEVPSKRFGDADEFGKLCAFLCSAAYITGQSILIDGGSYKGVF